ncbi:aldo/keto reductase [Winogradskyella vincentii]|uniref:Aldo/keto reductase n=1 Tax=Winogradskyella vincentii TaxID=2877122 RepID=A0ABS7XXC4_9FLAO|nr:aldo/keto reductase [Winogradskyella vincentii]MCA0151665.1 aldo/keto reductase [Winogradskyella vincentii]
MSKTKIGLGLAALGRPDYINIRSNTNVDKSIEAFKSNTLKILDESYALGLRDFDVAPSYGLGEQFLLEWNKTRNHSDVNLSTKFGYTYVANWKIGFEGKHEIKEHSLTKLNEQWETSKALLPNLKIYQIHSATLESGVLENRDVLSRLDELKQKHQLKIGITSSGTEQVKIIHNAKNVNVNGKPLFDSYQVTFNIFEQSCYKILKQLLKEDKTVIIKEALANGRVFRNNRFKNHLATYDYLETLAVKYKVSSDAIALRFIMDNLEPTLILSGASNTEQLKQNIKALNFDLDEIETSKLESFKVSPQQYWQERSNLDWN